MADQHAEHASGSDDPTRTPPEASEPAREDDTGTGIGDENITSGTEESAAELKKKLDEDPNV
ncbi:MAG: hypothetical protein JWO02_781 [Solirubrobacterales bacterium]|nr:hypothetical protein [Solirubrobacterales bacterium]